jgi:uncharacterized membrane protein
LVKSEISFQNLLEASFVIIRQMCSDNPSVVIYLLEAFMHLTPLAQRKADRQAIEQISRLTVDSALTHHLLAPDEQAIQQRFEQIKQALKLSEKANS